MNIYSQIRSNKIKTYLIIIFFIGLISFVFYVLGLYFEDPAIFLVAGLLLSFGSGFTSYFYSDKIVLKMAGAKLALKSEYFDYYTVTENLSIASGLPMPKLYVIDDQTPNAFATGRNPDHAVVAATTGLLSRLERSEIEGVIAHELSHVKNYDILVMSIVTVLVGTLVYTIDFFMRSMWRRGGSNDKNSKSGIAAIFLIVFLVLTPFLASIIQMAISRKREFLADASGALLTRNPEGLASALIKISQDPHEMKRVSSATAHMYIENPIKKGSQSSNWFSKLFMTHPPVEERVKILRSM